MELAVAPLLRSFMAVHGAEVVEPLPSSVEEAVLCCRACDRGGGFRAQGQRLLVQLVGKAVHLLLDDVGGLAYGPAEERRVLEDGRAHVAVAVASQPVAQKLLQGLPALGLV